jgi:hypothetical protein
MRFSEYIDKRAVNLTKFCKDAGIALGTGFKLYHKINTRLTVDRAQKIVNHSLGDVTYEDIALDVNEAIQKKQQKRNREDSTE